MATITFQNNVVDASKLGGGYVSWQLIPKGEIVSPANQKSKPVTIQATALNGNQSR